MRARAASGEPRHTIAMLSPASPRAALDVVVLHAHVDDFAARPHVVAAARALLDDRETARLARFAREVDGRMFLLGRLMARTLVGGALGCNPTAWTWREGERGRPEVGHPQSDVRFNLAHSAGLVVCAVTRQPIPLSDLRYWSVDRQEAYVSAEASLKAEGKS